MLYYQNANTPFRFSFLPRLSSEKRSKFIKKLKQEKEFWVEIIAYCLMPNHFHLLVKQSKDNGTFNFMRLFQNSYAHYFNRKNDRKGSLFEHRFKAVRIATEEQLFHLSRYIHLNPYSSYIVKGLPALAKYPHSSLPEYLSSHEPQLCQKEIILNKFANRSAYKKFVFDQADYQQSLEKIKHQALENQ